MSLPTFRYRYGDASPQVGPFITGVPYNLGDFMYVEEAVNVTPPDGNTQWALAPANTYALASAIADPSVAPTNTGVSASGLGPGYTIAGTGIAAVYTWSINAGVSTILESGPSPASARMDVNGDACQLSLPSGVVVPSGVNRIRWYVTADGGSTYRLAAETYAGVSGFTSAILPPSTAAAPPAANSLSALVVTQYQFMEKFLGLSAQTYPADQAQVGVTPITYGITSQYVRVDTAGVFDLTLLAAASFNDGDLVGISTLNGVTLDPQTVQFVPNNQIACALGRCVKGGLNLTTVRCQIQGPKRWLFQSPPG